MHRYEQRHRKLLDELAASPRISVTDTAVYRKHHQVKVPGNFPDVLQFSQILFFFFLWIYPQIKFGTEYGRTAALIGQIMSIPVVQIASMENTPATGLHHPGHSTVGTTCGRHPNPVVLPDSAFGQPNIRLFLLGPTPFQDIL